MIGDIFQNSTADPHAFKALFGRMGAIVDAQLGAGADPAALAETERTVASVLESASAAPRRAAPRRARTSISRERAAAQPARDGRAAPRHGKPAASRLRNCSGGRGQRGPDADGSLLLSSSHMSPVLNVSHDGRCSPFERRRTADTGERLLSAERAQAGTRTPQSACNV